MTNGNLAIYLDGRKKNPRTWTEAEAEAAPIIAAVAADGVRDSAFAFTTPAALEQWLARHGLQREYAKSQALLERSPKRISGEEETKLAAVQKQTTTRYANEFQAVLRDAGVPIEDPDAVVDLVTSYNPLTGPLIHSALLYQHINQQGSWRYLPKGWSWPNFNWLSFNDSCSSVTVILGGLLLWEHTWYKGRGILMYGYPGANFNIHAHPFYFNDRASSATTW